MAPGRPSHSTSFMWKLLFWASAFFALLKSSNIWPVFVLHWPPKDPIFSQLVPECGTVRDDTTHACVFITCPILTFSFTQAFSFRWQRKEKKNTTQVRWGRVRGTRWDEEGCCGYDKGKELRLKSPVMKTNRLYLTSSGVSCHLLVSQRGQIPVRVLKTGFSFFFSFFSSQCV